MAFTGIEHGVTALAVMKEGKTGMVFIYTYTFVY
jgi:hypothetical protein